MYCFFSDYSVHIAKAALLPGFSGESLGMWLATATVLLKIPWTVNVACQQEKNYAIAVQHTSLSSLEFQHTPVLCNYSLTTNKTNLHIYCFFSN